MKHRKLRIAWSVAWGTVAVLLTVLWVRSYWWADVVTGDLNGFDYLNLKSDSGTLQFAWILSDVPNGEASEWRYRTDAPSSPSPRYNWMRGHRNFIMPIPFALISPVIACAIIGPWLRVSNRFSLRTLLIATTLVAVGLGLIVWLRVSR